jgi:hypothetical protein
VCVRRASGAEASRASFPAILGFINLGAVAYIAQPYTTPPRLQLPPSSPFTPPIDSIPSPQSPYNQPCRPPSRSAPVRCNRRSAKSTCEKGLESRVTGSQRLDKKKACRHGRFVPFFVLFLHLYPLFDRCAPLTDATCPLFTGSRRVDIP